MIAGICFTIYRLNPSGIINMRDGWNFRSNHILYPCFISLIVEKYVRGIVIGNIGDATHMVADNRNYKVIATVPSPFDSGLRISHVRIRLLPPSSIRLICLYS